VIAVKQMQAAARQVATSPHLTYTYYEAVRVCFCGDSTPIADESLRLVQRLVRADSGLL